MDISESQILDCDILQGNMELIEEVIINDTSYGVYLEETTNVSIISIIGADGAYNNECTLTKKDIEILKSGLRQDGGLSYDIYKEGTNVVLRIKHSMINFEQIYTLAKQAQDREIASVTERRLYELEKNDTMCINITSTMLGPALIVDDKHNITLNRAKETIEATIYKSTSTGNKILIEISDHEMANITDYYDIKKVYSTIIPKICENELLFDGLLYKQKNDNKYYFFKIHNAYTILIKKKEESKNTIIINNNRIKICLANNLMYDLKRKCSTFMKTIDNCQREYCKYNEFINYGYIVQLPNELFVKYPNLKNGRFYNNEHGGVYFIYNNKLYNNYGTKKDSDIIIPSTCYGQNIVFDLA